MKLWKLENFFAQMIAALCFFYFSPLHAAPLRVAYSAISGAMSPLWTTQEGGYFRREGLDLELPYIGGGSLLIQSMLGGDIQFAYGPSVPVVNAALRGSDLVFIANTSDTLIYSVMTRPEIKDPADLKGKRIGVTRAGGSADLALDYGLKKWGLQRGRDVIVLQTGGLPESLAALRAGTVDGAVLSPPNNLLAKKAGLRELVDIGQLGIVFPNTALSTTRSFIRANRDTVMRFLRALGDGQQRLRNDKEFSMKVLSKYTKATDPEILSELYQIYGVRYTGQQIPYVRLDGVDEILKGMDTKEARQAKAADFVDNGLLKDIEQSGFFRKLYR
jgi:NitT/TauT family transport system substrate-binding protein